MCVHQCAARPNIGCNGHFDFSQGSRECTIVILACSSIFLDFARHLIFVFFLSESLFANYIYYNLLEGRYQRRRRWILFIPLGLVPRTS